MAGCPVRFPGEVDERVESFVGALGDGRTVEHEGGVEVVLQQLLQALFGPVDVLGVQRGGRDEVSLGEATRSAPNTASPVTSTPASSSTRA